jgi:hypothetical protein
MSEQQSLLKDRAKSDARGLGSNSQMIGTGHSFDVPVDGLRLGMLNVSS